MSCSSALDLTVKTLRELLDYDPDTGILKWKIRNEKYFISDERQAKSWNARYAGKNALTAIDQHGYNRGAVLGQTYAAHRIIWFWMTGEWPENIDHINGNRTDNRWENLRSVGRLENQKNMKLSKANTSGRTGVSWYKRAGKWTAVIFANGKNMHLGYFDDFEAACEMRSVAERNYLFHENHGRAA